MKELIQNHKTLIITAALAVAGGAGAIYMSAQQPPAPLHDAATTTATGPTQTLPTVDSTTAAPADAAPVTTSPQTTAPATSESAAAKPTPAVNAPAPAPTPAPATPSQPVNAPLMHNMTPPQIDQAAINALPNHAYSTDGVSGTTSTGSSTGSN